MSNPFPSFHRRYWRPDPEEHEKLLRRYPRELTWDEVMRLHHLNCLGIQESGESNDLYDELIQHLTSDGSPFRPRTVELWEDRDTGSTSHLPDYQGKMLNAASTHLGALEIITVSGDQPKAVKFVPYDNIHLVRFESSGGYRVAKIFYDDGAMDPLVIVPMVYAVHNLSEDDITTTFDVEAQGYRVGIPDGLQNIWLEGGMVPIPMLDLLQFTFSLDVDDPRFIERAQARDIDPEAFLEDFEEE